MIERLNKWKSERVSDIQPQDMPGSEEIDSYYNETPSAGILERDVDLLIVEELRCSMDFIRWFFHEVYPCEVTKHPKTIEDVSAEHSCLHIGDGYGESDIVLRTRDSDGRRHVFLIEDKINAAFTHRQAERYKERLKSLIHAGSADDGKTVLIAPKAFLQARPAASDFDIKISYEQLIDHFKSRSVHCLVPELSLRLEHRMRFLRRAIDKKNHSGPVQNPDPRVCNSREEYYRYVLSNAPKLGIKPLSKVKEPNEWIYYRDALRSNLAPKLFTLIHKPKQGAAIQVDIPPPFQKNAITKIRHLLYDDNGMEIKCAPGKEPKSFSILIATPELEMRNPMSNQLDALNQSILALIALQEWFEKNSDQIHQILSTIK